MINVGAFDDFHVVKSEEFYPKLLKNDILFLTKEIIDNVKDGRIYLVKSYTHGEILKTLKRAEGGIIASAPNTLDIMLPDDDIAALYRVSGYKRDL